jgi:hypothetical protein
METLPNHLSSISIHHLSLYIDFDAVHIVRTPMFLLGLALHQRFDTLPPRAGYTMSWGVVDSIYWDSRPPVKFSHSSLNKRHGRLLQ